MPGIDIAAVLKEALDLHGRGRPGEAAALYEQVIAAAPDHSGAHNLLGLIALTEGRLERALELFDRAVALKPGFGRAHFNRGNALMRLGRPGEALAAFDAAIEAEPEHAEAHNNRASALVALGRTDEALASLERSVALRPGDPTLHLGRAETLLNLGRHAAALEGFERALALNPDLADARWNRGLTLLALGRFAEGWAEYEQRWHVPAAADPTVPAELRARFAPELTADDLAGRHVLVVGEQGVGDVIMFASVLPDLMRVAGKVGLVCEPRLHRLFGASFPGLELRTPTSAPDAERVVAIGSLGRLFRNRPEDFPGTPYLSATPAAQARWAERLGPAKGLRVGIAWRGGVVRTRSDARSMPLAALRPLLDLPGCEFVSLQHGDVDAEIGAEGTPVRAFAAEDLRDFDDLAGLVQGLDLVVSVQTAVVHLAGALGAPALAMVPRQPEWRYASGGERMAWYGSVRLVRQGEDGDWGPVVAGIADEVRRRAAV